MIDPKSDARPRVLVLFDHGRGPERMADWEQDPGAFPYGYGYAAKYLRLTPSSNAKESRLGRFVRRGSAYVIGFDVVHAFRNRGVIRQADAVITHTEHEHLAVALLQKLGVVRDIRIVGQSIWIWDAWNSMGAPRRAFYRWLLREISVHTVHSPVNAEFGTRMLGERVHLVPYGAHVRPDTDVGFSPPPPSSTVDVVAPGSDKHRDWVTLVEAARLDERIRVTILSRRRRPRRVAATLPGRVTVRAAASFADVQAVMQESAVVAVPLKPNKHVSGLTVLFESLLARRPVAITRTGGSDFYAGDHVDWARPGDPRSLLDAIHSAARRAGRGVELDDAWHTVADRGLTLKDYGLRHAVAVWLALGLPADERLLCLDQRMESLIESESRRLKAQSAVRPGESP